MQDKVGVRGPDIAWEIHIVLGEAPDMACMPNRLRINRHGRPDPGRQCRIAPLLKHSQRA